MNEESAVPTYTAEQIAYARTLFKRWCDVQGIKIPAAALLVLVKRDTLYTFINQSKVSHRTLKKISEAMGISLDFLTTPRDIGRRFILGMLRVDSSSLRYLPPMFSMSDFSIMAKAMNKEKGKKAHPDAAKLGTLLLRRLTEFYPTGEQFLGYMKDTKYHDAYLKFALHFLWSEEMLKKIEPHGKSSSKTSENTNQSPDTPDP